MEPWFEVKMCNVVDLITRQKVVFPWGDHPDETYSCLVFREDGVIRMTVNAFYKLDSHTYECCRFYTDTLAETSEEYRTMKPDQFAAKAYNAWCSGAR